MNFIMAILVILKILAVAFLPGPLILLPFIVLIGGPALIYICHKGILSASRGQMVFFGALILTGIAGYVYFLIYYPTYGWHQKLTVEVETSQGIVSGSSVVGVWWETPLPNPLGPEQSARIQRIRGEATAVQLPDGRYLFALLKDVAYLAPSVFAKDKIDRGQRFSLPAAAEVSRMANVTKVVPPEYYPLLVTFTDINDPLTVKKVDPNNMAEWFGPGVSLKSVTLEITREPVTTDKIGRLLKWLTPYPEPSLGPAKGEIENIPFYNLVHHADFLRR